MHIEVLGAESLGVRGLSCLVETRTRRVVIDPGLALGYQRHGQLPHPVQVAVGEQVRMSIRAALTTATDVVISHFHGDHIPLLDANPFQLRLSDVASDLQRAGLWAKGPQKLSNHMLQRRTDLAEAIQRDLPSAENAQNGALTFSAAVPHGTPKTHLGSVMMTRIEDAGTVFVHASDIQLLNAESVSQILDWAPDIVLAGGPPFYLQRLSQTQRRRAWHLALELALGVNTLILDHHILRSREGLGWLERLEERTGHRVICAADFMQRPRCLLEADRQELYQEIPVPEGWHEAYARGETSTEPYRHHPGCCA